MTMRPRRRRANAVSATESRGGGTSAIKASAASMRYRGLDVRAGGPRRNQANSLRARLRRRASAASACRPRSARAKVQSAYPPSYDSTLPSTTSQVRVATVSRNHRSCVTTTNAVEPDPRVTPLLPADRASRCSASHCTPSTSRWLVGSSRISRSRSRTSAAASPTRRRWPPES
ncbi:Uncharacterised protein [Mycobacteroides abscessus subsp. abscessus]|nr:Uncharacterised protein [Mycobacteroides abscessus subsp. abscessus]